MVIGPENVGKSLMRLIRMVIGTVNVVNYGTGPLTIQPTGLSGPFVVIPPEDIVPSGIGQLTIQYDPSKSGPSQQTLTIVSNDTSAGTQAAHNQVVKTGPCANHGCGHEFSEHQSV